MTFNRTQSNGVTPGKDPEIEVNDLTFKFPDGSLGLQNISLSLPAGSRTLLIGGNS